MRRQALLPLRHRRRNRRRILPRLGRNFRTAGPATRLTVQDAESLALRNNPQISVYKLLALASHQITRENKAAYYPTFYGSLTAVEPEPGSRISAGNLNNPIIYQRVAGGVTLEQLITDFGRTNNLVAMAALRAKASDMNSAATALQIKLAVDQAFYNALQANAELQVAQQTVKARQDVSDQITALFNNKLKSQVDVSFADANLVAGQVAVARCPEQLSGISVGVVRSSRLFLAAAVRAG